MKDETHTSKEEEILRDEFINKEWLHWSSAQSKFVRIPDSSKMEIANYWLTIRQQAIAEERERTIDILNKWIPKKEKYLSAGGGLVRGMTLDDHKRNFANELLNHLTQ